MLANGTYTGAGNRDLVVDSKAITLKSASGDPALCVLDAQSTTRVIQFLGDNPGAVLEGITITGGHASEAGGIYSSNSTLSLIKNCVIRGNIGGEPGGAYFTNSSPRVEGCLFYDNTSAGRGGAIHCFNASPVIMNCTIAANSAPYGGGIYCNGGAPQVEKTIIALNRDGQPVSGSVGIHLVCCDVNGNSAGDWVGPIADQLGVDGNFTADPLFCDGAVGEFSLRADSPCLPGRHPDGPGCGLIGALGQGCLANWPVISQIADVGNDQGRQARLLWQRSDHDALGSSTPISSYAIFRRQDRYKCAGAPVDQKQPADNAALSLVGPWDFVTTVPAFGEDTYQCVVPTLCDSTVAGVCWSVFAIRAINSSYVYFDSPPDSGYSTDNLAPNAPENLKVLASILSWDESVDEDFAYYSVFGVDGLGQTNLLLHTTQTAVDVATNPAWAYRVTATDFAGNESAAATIMMPTSVPAPITDALVLHQNVPNPFNPTTIISFDLPAAGLISLSVYDLYGRLIKRLCDNSILPAGRHEFRWDGKSDNGMLMGAGVYLARLESASQTIARRMVLLK